MDFAASSFDFVNQNTLHPIGIAALVVACLLLLAAPLRWIPVVLIGLAVYIPTAQRVVLGGADFSFLRIGILVALARVVLSQRSGGFRLGWIDAMVVAGTLAKVLLMPVVTGQMGILFQQVGGAIDTLGMYLVVRLTIRSIEDVGVVARRSVLVCLPVAAIFAIEKSSGRNMLSIFGGVPLMTDIREGRLRCQGAFAHAILAGCFFVALLPLWIAQWRAAASGRVAAVAGVLLTLVVVGSCASSTPVAALMLVCIAFAWYPIWRHLRTVWVAALLVGFVLHFIMQHGIWHLLARVDLVGGSTGYHRYHLIEQAIEHLDEWWLVGTLSTRHWGWGLQDVTNQYVLEGVRGGIWAMAALVVSIVLALRACGFWLRRLAPGSREHLAIYAIGVSIFAQMWVFLAVSYFGQATMIWCLTLGAAAFLAEARAVEEGRIALPDEARAVRSVRAVARTSVRSA